MQTNIPTHILKILTGQWQFNRHFSYEGSAKGVATFSTRENSLFYRETGILHLHQSFNFYREYIFSKNKNSIDVWFVNDNEKGQFFYKLEKCSHDGDILKMQGSHRCVNDNYLATYKIFGPDRFDVHYQIKGPKKDYCIYTKYILIRKNTRTDNI